MAKITALRSTMLLLLLISGSLALPPSSQNHLRGSVRAKQTTPSYASESKLSSNSSKQSPTSASTITLPATTATLPISSASSSPPTSASRASAASSSAPKSPTPSVATSSATTSRSVDPAVTTRSSAISSSSPPASSVSSTASVPSTTVSSNPGPSAAPLETSSRTIVSAQDSTTNLASSSPSSSSRKSTTIAADYSTTSASVSAKETRESPGKIRPQIKITTNYTSIGETGVRLPEGASAALAKPTKYHYYPHNQHIYLLPECAVQQVCNAVYVRLNFTQPLCACPGRYRDPCSASLDSDDLHTTELVTDPRTKALTLVKTCEPVAEMRECRTPRDWSLLALQNVRTGKSHYLVICRCPDANILEGPMSHDQPTYASVPGIRVYGMMCVQGNRRGRPLRYRRDVTAGESEKKSLETEEGSGDLSFPWHKVDELMKTADWD